VSRNRNRDAAADETGYRIPPEVYELGCGWDPHPEINRLLFLARENGIQPASALELGCGTGRLLRALGRSVPDVWGLELSAAMAQRGRASGAGDILVGHMSDFALGRRFELIYTSANTIRHVLTNEGIARMWQCIGAHLAPRAVFVADLEFGFADQAAKVGKPATWTISRGQTEVQAIWMVTAPPSRRTRRCKVEYTFEARGPNLRGKWQERFELRTYEAPEFLELASRGAGLEPAGIYIPRDPYLFETPPEKATGRCVVVLRRGDVG
jgi:SAM-dependent methyltransferase